MNRWITPSLVLLCAWLGTCRLGLADPPRALTFEQHIWPILRAHCLDCHGAEKEKQGNLDLRQRRRMLTGGDSGAAIEPGNAEASYLIERIVAGEMPPGAGHVSADELQTLRDWINAGAATARPEPEQIDDGLGIKPEERLHWAYQPLTRPQPPQVHASVAPRGSIDQFVIHRMQQVGLEPSAAAPRLKLLLRLCFDLTGLPPSDEQLARFLNDTSPDAYEQLVDRLLSSPAYGQRWGRHWLDAAGYADSEGYGPGDRDRPHAWRYRDYVVDSLNAGKPLDGFIHEQLAGDEMVSHPFDLQDPKTLERLTATGFLRMAADGTAEANTEEVREQAIADTIKIVSTSLMGLSVGCAQCHDHRYDPIPQKDYFRMRAVFEPALNPKNWQTPAQRLISLYSPAQREAAAAIENQVAEVAREREAKLREYLELALQKELEKHAPPLRQQLREAYETPADKRSPEQSALLMQYPSTNINAGNLYQYNQAHADALKKYDERMATLRAEKPAEHFVRVLTEPDGNLPSTFVHHRGDYRQPTDEVQPASLTVLAPAGQPFVIEANEHSLPTSGRRLAFARHLTSRDNPLVARVLVNRIWMHFFGRGIVATPADFGRLGTAPSHPELLDWLADELLRSGWNLKHLQRLIVTSAVYRQASTRNPASDAIDGANQYLWHFPVRRLEAEVIRDRCLEASGQLSRELGGPPIPIVDDDAGQTLVDGEQRRRSIYIQMKRSRPVAFLQTFDQPVMETNCDRRQSSTVATQSLALMNGKFIVRQSELMSERVRRDAANAELTPELAAAMSPLMQSSNPAWDHDGTRLCQELVAAWRIAYRRLPTDEEAALLARFAMEQRDALGQADQAEGGVRMDQQIVTNVCQVLMSSSEFLYID